MTDKHQTVITEKLETLVNSLSPDPILVKLVASGIFTMREKRKVQALSTLDERADELLSLLVRKQDKAFYVFIKACEENNMEHIAHALRRAGNYLVACMFLPILRKSIGLLVLVQTTTPTTL